MKFDIRFRILFSLLFLTNPTAAEEDVLTKLANRFCIKCHGAKKPKGELQLHQLNEDFFGDIDQLELIVSVLSENEMPPRKSSQPPEELRSAAIDILKERLKKHGQPGNLKRLTRDEYTNTINDLFNTQFNLTELLPPDPPGEGFNKWGETQRMSPHQVESYLRTARFVADRLILSERPVQRSWEFDISNFQGTGRGDFQTSTEHVLTTHYPWRSILYFVEGQETRSVSKVMKNKPAPSGPYATSHVTDTEEQQIFQIPQFGRYWIQTDAAVHYSNKAETISLSTGDPRYPTNIKKIARAVLQPNSKSIFFDVTLNAGTKISFTYDSAATWNTDNKKDQYKGRQVRFTKVRITGPVTESWPTFANKRIFDGDRFRSLSIPNVRSFTKHTIHLLLNRSLPEADVTAFAKLTDSRLEQTGSSNAAAKTLLMAILSSPHFIYKNETESLSDIALAHRLSYFLWNSVPDETLLKEARSGKLRSSDTLSSQVERLLNDLRSNRFCEDFTQQWLSTDRIDDIGPDDRVHDKKRVTFMKVRELAKEPQAFFREMLQQSLSMDNFIDSDFAMINDETAEYYGFGDVKGRSFKRVAIPKKSERGGLIGQAGLLKLTSTKHATSPILRGTWILKNIYGEKLNPPPGLAVEEPDIRSAKTVKDVIELHKNTETCNRCHSRIDPFGLALEHYDEMGLWRDEYQHIETQVGDKTIKKVKASIDSSATLPDGREIKSMTDLKAVFRDDRERIIKGILSKIASYALGREISLRDEAMIGELYDQIAEKNYSLRAAIHAIVAHKSFAQK